MGEAALKLCIAMSQDEKITNIEKEVNAIKRWWPVLAACVTILLAVITLTITATSAWDNKVAKKEDISALSDQLKKVSNQVSDISADFKEYKSRTSHERIIDSIDKEKIKKDLLDHIRLANNEYKDVLNRFTQMTYHEQYYFDKNGKRNVTIVQN